MSRFSNGPQVNEVSVVMGHDKILGRNKKSNERMINAYLDFKGIFSFVAVAHKDESIRSINGLKTSLFSDFFT